jgi:hypothetical protein
MPTTVISTVKPGGGGDYTSLQAWESAEQRDLVAADEIEQAVVDSSGNASDGTVLSIGGWTTDDTRYIEVIAESGHEHEGKVDTSKAHLSLNSSVGSGVSITGGIRTRWTKFQIFMTGSTSGSRWNMIGGTNNVVDRCILEIASTSGAEANVRFSSGQDNVIKSSYIIRSGSNSTCIQAIGGSSHRIYVSNCTCKGGTNCLSASLSGNITSENNYLFATSAVYSGGTRITKGSNDATSTTEATDSNLQNVPYSTATFQDITASAQDLHLKIVAGNKLINNGEDLSTDGGAGSVRNVTLDIDSASRPFGGIGGEFDIGADEQNVPVCWNYTAFYKGSHKTFKMTGPGPFPKKLGVPSNVNVDTGIMIDDGILIDSGEYEVIQGDK